MNSAAMNMAVFQFFGMHTQKQSCWIDRYSKVSTFISFIFKIIAFLPDMRGHLVVVLACISLKISDVSSAC